MEVHGVVSSGSMQTACGVGAMIALMTIEATQLVLPQATPDTTGQRLRNRVSLEVANLKEATAVIAKNHYLHRGRTMAQLPYWITLDGEQVGVVLYAYPRMSARFEGFGPMNLLELARMWLDPRVQGQQVVDGSGNSHSLSVATCAIGMSLRRVRADWERKYPHLPDVLAVVSWADQVHHEGTLYRAANFREVGVSGGSLHGSSARRNGGRDNLNLDYLHPKTSFIYEFPRPWKRQHQREAGQAGP